MELCPSPVLMVLLSVSTLPVSLSLNISHEDPAPLSPLPVLAATGPLLQDQAFVVVWNIPTSRCHRHFNVQLNLRRYNIVENPQQRFQGQEMTIFYRNRLGLYPYLSNDGRKVNGGTPQLANLTAHLSLTVAQMSAWLRPDFAGLAVIDWEDWRPLWETNFGSKMAYRRLSKQLVKRQRPGLSDRDAALLARQRFEESARRFMEETLRAGVRGHPKGLWGFYGFPACYNKNKRKTDKIYTGRCHRETQQQSERLHWLWTRSSALYPSIYLPQSLAGSADAALMVRNRVREALRVAARWPYGSNSAHVTPVLPYARLAFTHSLTFLNKTDLAHTLGESASLGAAGVVLWGERRFAKSKDQCLLLRDYLHTVLGPFVRSLWTQTERCSRQLCHGNGRCTRRRLGSGHMVFSGQTSISHFQKHFKCECYSGWRGRGCGLSHRQK